MRRLTKDTLRMKTLRTILLGFVALPCGLFAQTAPVTCSNATLTGPRAVTVTGRGVNTSVALSKTFQAVGAASFDGVGTVTFTLVTNTNVAQNMVQTWSGTYTLGSNCVGSVTTTSGDSGTFTLIAYNKGNGFTITGQDGTYALTGTGSPLPPACITSSLSGAYAFSGNGYSFSGNTVAGVNTVSGLLQFDGRGNITGSWSVAISGTATPDTVTGHYAVTSQCQGTGTVTDPSGASWSLNLSPTSVAAADFSLLIGNATSSFQVSGHSTFTNPGLSVTNAANGGSSDTPPGSIFALYGSGLTTGSTQANVLPLPTTLLTTSVSINGAAAPLFYMSGGQINAQMPWNAQPGLAAVTVNYGSSMSNTAAVNIPAAATPEIFLYGSNRAVVQNADFSLNSSTAPAKVGDTVVGYFTGGGPVKAAGPLVSGAASPSGLSPVTGAPVLVTVGGATASVSYIGLTPTLVGLYQVNFAVPKVASGDRNLVISIGGVASDPALITVQ
jgi:uncharacterized protein (TIGR03437 family)